MNNRELLQEQAAASKLSGIASIIASIPRVAVLWIIGILTLMLISFVWLFFTWLTLVLTILFWLIAILIASAIVRHYAKIGFSAFKAVHDASMMSIEKQRAIEGLNKARIANQREVERLTFDRMLKPMVVDAVAMGKNFSYTAKGDVHLTDWKSNIHALPSAEGLSQVPQLSSPFSVGGRLSMEKACEVVGGNSYQFCPGTTDDGKTPLIGLKKKHLKFVGTSQMGKSSLVGFCIDQITHTHSADNLHLVMLDIEGLNSNLFKAMPHTRYVAQADIEQIVNGLEWVTAELEYRYSKGPKFMADSPFMLVWIEEYLDLRTRVKVADKKLYNRFTTAMTTIATRSLKSQIAMWLTMQSDYSDNKDLQAALATIPYGLCLCIEPSAGRGAGFPDTALLNENFRRAKAGVAVAYTPEYKGFITSGEYDIAKKNAEYEESDAALYEFVNPVPSSRRVEVHPLEDEMPETEPLELEPDTTPIDIHTVKEARMRKVATLRGQGFNQTQIIHAVWGVSKGGSASYQRARAEYEEIMSSLLLEDLELDA